MFTDKLIKSKRAIEQAKWQHKTYRRIKSLISIKKMQVISTMMMLNRRTHFSTVRNPYTIKMALSTSRALKMKAKMTISLRMTPCRPCR